MGGPAAGIRGANKRETARGRNAALTRAGSASDRSAIIKFGQYAGVRGACVRGWSIDSRTVDKGDLFFAIRGERFDGHAFVGPALERGAMAAVVSEDLSGAQGPLVKVLTR